MKISYNLTGLTDSEIKILIDKHNVIISTTKDYQLKKNSKFIIITLKRELDFRYQEKKLGYTTHKSRNTTNVKNLCRNMLDILGYSHNSLYKEECEILTERLCVVLRWEEPQGRSYSNEALSIVIVDEILKHYNSKYNEYKLLDLYQVPIDTFITLSTSCHKWCEKNYWKPKITT